MNERDTFVSSDDTVRKNRKPNRKEPKQISFRVREDEYLKLQQFAETLNMSVCFRKEKAQGSRLVVPKFDKNAIIYCQIFKYVGANANQIAKYCNQHQYEVPNYKALEYNIHKLRERLDDIWQRLR